MKIKIKLRVEIKIHKEIQKNKTLLNLIFWIWIINNKELNKDKIQINNRTHKNQKVNQKLIIIYLVE